MKKMKLPKIEKGIPIPAQAFPFKRVLRGLKKTGHSVLLPKNINRTSVFPAAKRVGIKVTIRQLRNGQYRCWRIE